MDSSPAFLLRDVVDALEATAASAPFVVEPEALTRHPLPPLARRLALLFDGRRSTREVFREAGLAPAKGEAVVRKLGELGIIRPGGAAWSAEDEAFFASEVQPLEEDDAPAGLFHRLRLLLHI
jgi:hypothetical protein